MTLSDFTDLNDAGKAEAVYNALFISHRKTKYFKYHLYYLAVGNFYVEAEYCIEKDELRSFRPFQSLKFLEPYTDEFSVLNLI
jgi:hypothetical protein